MRFVKTLVTLTMLWSVLSSCVPSTPTPAVAIPPQETFTYIVKAGDTCSALAERFETTVAEIVTLNGLAASCPIMIGQALKIPATDAAQSTTVPTATPEVNGMTVYLNAEFPQTPATMNVYTAHEEQSATVDSVRALAKQFKMNGAIYELNAQSGIYGGMLGGEKEYLVVDGNRQLRVRSDKYFSYIPDNVSQQSNLFIANPPGAETAIQEFMQAYGFDSAYRIEQANSFSYAALILSPEGLDLRYDSMQFNGLRFYFDKNGITLAEANLLDYDQTASMKIISAEEAFQKFFSTVQIRGKSVIG